MFKGRREFIQNFLTKASRPLPIISIVLQSLSPHAIYCLQSICSCSVASSILPCLPASLPLHLHLFFHHIQSSIRLQQNRHRNFVFLYGTEAGIAFLLPITATSTSSSSRLWTMAPADPERLRCPLPSPTPTLGRHEPVYIVLLMAAVCLRGFSLRNKTGKLQISRINGGLPGGIICENWLGC